MAVDEPTPGRCAVPRRTLSITVLALLCLAAPAGAEPPLRELPHKTPVLSLACSPDGSRLTAAGVGEHLIWNHTMGGASGSRSGGKFEGAFAAVSPDGRIAAWGRPDGQIQSFDVDARQFRHYKLGPATALAF